MADNSPILEVRNLTVKFRSGGQLLPAVDRCSLTIGKGEVLGLVGESGSGKSATAMAMLGLLPQSAVVEGDVHFDGHNILTLPEAQLTALRGRRISMIFQDPMSSLNPVLTIGDRSPKLSPRILAFLPETHAHGPSTCSIRFGFRMRHGVSTPTHTSFRAAYVNG